MNERLLRRVLNAETAGLCLILLAIQLLLYGVESAIRLAEVGNLFWLCLVGVLFGLVGGKNRWNGWQLSVAVVILGVAGIWIVGAKVLDPMLQLIRSILAAGPSLVPVISFRFDIDAHGIASSWTAIHLATSALLVRWQTWLLAITDHNARNDVLITNMIWALALWLLSAWVGWHAAKRKALAALLPGAVLLTFLLWSSERHTESLWAYVMVMLLLMALWNYRNLTQHWETNYIDYSDSIRIDTSQYLLMVIAIVGVLSYITPSISWREVRDYFRERERPAEQAVLEQPASSTSTAPLAGNLAPRSTLPREHLLTAGYAQSEEIVMTIRTGELPPAAMYGLNINAPRHYWRSVIYDRYDGRGWFTTSAPPQSIAADQPMIAGVLSGYRPLHLDVQMQQPEGKLFWSGILYSANIPLKVDWRLKPASNLFADQTALLQADLFAAHTDATTYRADTFVPDPSIEELRAAAAAENPEHIRILYLSLPGSLPGRVHSLAEEITAGKRTTYDKAKAIESYLRTNYPYDLTISAPPQDQDVVDYFLFDLKRGYCDYYATAMVVLARSAGIPARFVSGYAPGEYDVSSAEYIVRELHAHSWAEVYFAEIGWVEFEPTGSQPEIERPETDLPIAENGDPRSNAENSLLRWTGWERRTLFVPLGIVLAIGLLYFTVIEPLSFVRIAPAMAIEILYQRLYRSARPLAGKPEPAETGVEFMNKLIQNVEAINARFHRSPQVLQKDIRDLTEIYQAALFSDHQIESHHVKHALRIWSRLRWSLLFERIKLFFWMRNTRSGSS